jgi:hypothetical protein
MTEAAELPTSSLSTWSQRKMTEDSQYELQDDDCNSQDLHRKMTQDLKGE